MEESGEQSAVVFALILMKPARGGGGYSNLPPPSTHAHSLKFSQNFRKINTKTAVHCSPNSSMGQVFYSGKFSSCFFCLGLVTWTVLMDMAQRKWARENSAAETPSGQSRIFENKQNHIGKRKGGTVLLFGIFASEIENLTIMSLVQFIDCLYKVYPKTVFTSQPRHGKTRSCPSGSVFRGCASRPLSHPNFLFLWPKRFDRWNVKNISEQSKPFDFRISSHVITKSNLIGKVRISERYSTSLQH